MTQNAEFDRCVDFLARMIEKYGGEVDLTNTANIESACNQQGCIVHFEKKQ